MSVSEFWRNVSIPRRGPWERRAPRPATVYRPDWWRIVGRTLMILGLLALLFGLFHLWRMHRFRQPGGVVPVDLIGTRNVTPGDTVLLDLPVVIPDVPPALDLMLVTDMTSSYGDDVANLRSVSASLAADLANDSDVRFGLATFSDFRCCDGGGQDDFPFDIEQPLDGDASRWLASINGLAAPEGGGDEAEASLFALDQLTKDSAVQWRDDATRIIVLSTDADTKLPSETDVPGSALNDVAKRLKADGVHLVVTAPEESDLENLDGLIAEVDGIRLAIQSDGSDIAAAVKSGVGRVVASVTPTSECGGLPVAFTPAVVRGAAGSQQTVEAEVQIPNDQGPGRIECTISAGDDSATTTLINRPG